MWLITTFGFFSIVEKPADRAAGRLTVRARVKADLEALGAEFLPTLGPIEESSSTDYRFRARAPKADVAAAVAKATLAIDYSNFKNAVAARQGTARANLYHDVWSALYPLQMAVPFPRKASARAGAISTRSANFGTKASGGVLVGEDGLVLLREPTGHYGGYTWTFPKGRFDGANDTTEACALREVKEETGYDAQVLGKLPGPYKGEVTDTDFFLMRPLGDPSAFDPRETASLAWVSFEDAAIRINLTRSQTGRRRDQAVLGDARRMAVALGLVRTDED